MCKRGDIFFADLGPESDTSVQTGFRPVIIVSNDMANVHSPVVTVVPLTCQLKKPSLPTHVIIGTKDCRGLDRTSMALAEQVMSIDKSQLRYRKGRITSRRTMGRVTSALKVQIGAQ